jgi:GT2 family glycosyltransferase
VAQTISFIITARNEPTLVLAATIDQLLTTSTGHQREIVVIDDASETPVLCPSEGITLIRNPAPLGVARARRQGATVAAGDVLVWLDAHMTFAHDWLDRMLEHVESGSLLCSAYWNYEQSICYGCGADFTWCSGRNYALRRSPGFGLRHRRPRLGRGAVDVPMAVGACYMLLRRSYDALGGFCPFFRVWGVDEQDISARAWMAGLGVQCVVDCRVGHLCRSAFPYPVHYDHLEFNQLVMLRSLFDAATVKAVETCFDPVSAQVRGWLDETDLGPWRTAIQSRRCHSDAEFFRRFLPEFFWSFGAHERRAPE